MALIHTSRSKIVARFQCPRYRYLKYHYGGQGLQRIATKHPTNAGLAIHKGNSLVLMGEPVDKAVATVMADYAKVWEEFKGIPHEADIRQEQQHLIEGSIRAFARVRVPQLRRLGDIFVIESEHSAKLTPDIVYDFRPDVGIRTDMGILIVDWKPSADGGLYWVKGWERNHQVLAYVWAAQEIFQEPILGIKIEGYVKGKRRFDKAFGRKIQNSPLCYVYENDYDGTIVPDYQAAGKWTKRGLWETSFTVKEWVEEALSKEQVEKHFLAPVPEICPTPQQIERWHRQTSHSESQVEQDAKFVEIIRQKEDYELWQRAMDEVFPQNMDSCYKYGEDFPCEMDCICFNEQVAQDPLASGLLEPRVDHHGEEEETT